MAYYKWDPLNNYTVPLRWLRPDTDGDIVTTRASIAEITDYINRSKLDILCNIEPERLLNIIIYCDYMVRQENNHDIWLPNTYSVEVNLGD